MHSDKFFRKPDDLKLLDKVEEESTKRNVNHILTCYGSREFQCECVQTQVTTFGVKRTSEGPDKNAENHSLKLWMDLKVRLRTEDGASQGMTNSEYIPKASKISYTKYSPNDIAKNPSFLRHTWAF